MSKQQAESGARKYLFAVCYNFSWITFQFFNFNLKDVQYNLRGLSTRLDLPAFNLEFMRRSFTFLASKLWNALPPKVRESQDIASFKRFLKAHMA